MRFKDIDPRFMEQAFSRKDVLAKFAGFHYTLNAHILKVLAFDEPLTAASWKREIKAWLKNIAAFRLRYRGNRPVPADMFWQEMFEGPFGHDPEGEVTSWLANIQREHSELRRNEKSVKEIVNALKTFLLNVGERIEAGDDFADLIDGL